MHRTLREAYRCLTPTCTADVLSQTTPHSHEEADLVGATCAERISWLMDEQRVPEEDACLKVARDEYPDQCGACSPEAASALLADPPNLPLAPPTPPSVPALARPFAPAGSPAVPSSTGSDNDELIHPPCVKAIPRAPSIPPPHSPQASAMGSLDLSRIIDVARIGAAALAAASLGTGLTLLIVSCCLRFLRASRRRKKGARLQSHRASSKKQTPQKLASVDEVSSRQEDEEDSPAVLPASPAAHQGQFRDRRPRDVHSASAPDVVDRESDSVESASEVDNDEEADEDEDVPHGSESIRSAHASAAPRYQQRHRVHQQPYSGRNPAALAARARARDPPAVECSTIKRLARAPRDRIKHHPHSGCEQVPAALARRSEHQPLHHAHERDKHAQQQQPHARQAPRSRVASRAPPRPPSSVASSAHHSTYSFVDMPYCEEVQSCSHDAAQQAEHSEHLIPARTESRALLWAPECGEDAYGHRRGFLDLRLLGRTKRDRSIASESDAASCAGSQHSGTTSLCSQEVHIGVPAADEPASSFVGTTATQPTSVLPNEFSAVPHCDEDSGRQPHALAAPASHTAKLVTPSNIARAQRRDVVAREAARGAPPKSGGHQHVQQRLAVAALGRRAAAAAATPPSANGDRCSSHTSADRNLGDSSTGSTRRIRTHYVTHGAVGHRHHRSATGCSPAVRMDPGLPGCDGELDAV